MKHLTTILVAVAALFAVSCLKNDIPYPVIQLNIEGVEGEGFSVDNINATERTVTLKLDEATDIRNVTIDKVILTESAKPSRELTGTFDMRTPLYVTLSLYQDYEWSIVAEQTIDRRFSVEGQIGATAFDLKNRTATVYVGKTADLTDITVKELRLGSDDLTAYSPAVSELSGDFTTFRFVDVTCHDRTERWKLYVLITEKSVELRQADAWSRVIWLYGSGITGETMGFRYRKVTPSNDGAWLEAKDKTTVTVTGGSFEACLPVDAETEYEIKAYCGADETEPAKRTTEGIRQLPNAGMESWTSPSQYSGKSWLPYLLDASEQPIDAFWGTGNPGAVTLGEKYNLTTGVQTTVRPGSAGKTSAQLQSRYVAIKLAAGNLFMGSFAGIYGGTHGVVNFGQPFTLRPTAIRVWAKYNCGVINNAKDIQGMPVGMTIKVGDSDNGAIYAALGTWTKEQYGLNKEGSLTGTDASPVSIDTRATSTFFDSKGPNVIAYGEKIFFETVGEWTCFDIELTYRATNEVPTHLILVCSASRWGDYFTGSRDSEMWVDDIELLYDYEFKK